MYLFLFRASFLLFLWKIGYCTRYGNNEDYCIDGTIAETSKSGVTKWCESSDDCSSGWECVASGKYHFSKQIMICCQMRESICSMPPNPGFGDCLEQPKIKFYFDSIDLKCKKFQVISCHITNQNQFDTFEHCTQFCQTTACLAGQSLLLSRDSSPISCSDNKCPTGYRCVYDKLFNKHVCCGHSPTGVCPIGTISYSHARVNQPLRCTPSPVRDYCPSDFVCTAQGLHNFCCSPHNSICPAGQQPYVHVVSKLTMKCNPLEMAPCPATYYCSPAVPGAYWGFCCSVHVEAQCPINTEPFIEVTTGKPIRCTVGVTKCNIGYTCQSSQDGSLIGFCCTVPKITNSGRDEKRKTSGDGFKSSQSDYFLNLSHEGLRAESDSFQYSTISQKSKLTSPSLFSSSSSSSSSSYGVTSRYRPTTCPPSSKSVYYPGTQINIECSPTKDHVFQCPIDHMCVDAHLDFAGRMLCCKFPKTTATPSFVYYVTSIPRLVRYKTIDSYCPYAIKSLRCHPSKSICPMGYYCQYLMETASFSCCSLY